MHFLGARQPLSLSTASLFLAVSLLGGVTAHAQQQWKTAQTLPDVDLTGLTASQKAEALKLLREHDCSCGCNMKVAQCRIMDPGCTYSHGLAQTIAAALKEGKTESQAIALADASRYAHPPQATPQKILEDPVAIPVAGSPFAGPVAAPITIVEFSDFQCPYCAQAIPQIEALLKLYPLQVKLVFKQYPLEIHPQSQISAAAALAAQKQGKFWPMHNALFANHNNLSRETIVTIAQQNGLDMKQFEHDLDSAEVRDTIARDVKDGDAAGVEGTPTLFVNGQKYNGPIDVSTLQPLLEQQLKAPRASL